MGRKSYQYHICIIIPNRLYRPTPSLRPASSSRECRSFPHQQRTQEHRNESSETSSCWKVWTAWGRQCLAWLYSLMKGEKFSKKKQNLKNLIFCEPGELVKGRGGHDDFSSSFDITPLTPGHHGHRIAAILGVEGARDVREEVHPSKHCDGWALLCNCLCEVLMQHMIHINKLSYSEGEGAIIV